ncbi:ferric-dicitrate binding protein FerR (iron transport regulator) [Pedobacter sp. AK017]|uniref:FecR family protein n=1 Tax=Pedobacter sp. AK017 TaxID=2723073 RepID=UPI00161CF324|nr:FecR family protein [Pedobacter sp. AK017]MBB5440689.1 ferric-dicitrate binding protein FerR (iron transport regulator) [Pedobacter sp. AK017]
MEQDVQQLLSKHKAGTATAQEIALVNRWYATEAARLNMPEGPPEPLLEEQLIWDRIKAAIPLNSELPVKEAKPKKLNDLKWLAIAASLLILLSAGFYLYKNTYNHEAEMARLRAHDIKPGGNKATLTLADGTQLALDDQADGEIAKQAGTSISKTTNGQLIYTVKDNPTGEVTNNTISTPRGGQYQVNLPDGTKVWLNAQSSLTFPTAFTGNRRLVNLKGEGYFEVAKLKKMPFIVEANKQTVFVYGTHFNVNSYVDEERTKTTLLEGSVDVLSTEREQAPKAIFKIATLKPGQQAEFSNGHLKVQQADVEEAIAWKNGKFKFSNENIESLMRKVARWYDVDIEYKGKISKEGFGGQVSRSRNVSEILEVLQLTRLVHFEIEGRRIIVSSE